MKEENKEMLCLIASGLLMAASVWLFVFGFIRYNHSLDLQSYSCDWQPLYWAADERVIDEEGVPLEGRVVDGVIQIAREE